LLVWERTKWSYHGPKKWMVHKLNVLHQRLSFIYAIAVKYTTVCKHAYSNTSCLPCCTVQYITESEYETRKKKNTAEHRGCTRWREWLNHVFMHDNGGQLVAYTLPVSKFILDCTAIRVVKRNARHSFAKDGTSGCFERLKRRRELR
jgi:hypothetical protein